MAEIESGQKKIYVRILPTRVLFTLYVETKCVRDTTTALKAIFVERKEQLSWLEALFNKTGITVDLKCVCITAEPHVNKRYSFRWKVKRVYHPRGNSQL